MKSSVSCSTLGFLTLIGKVLQRTLNMLASKNKKNALTRGIANLIRKGFFVPLFLMLSWGRCLIHIPVNTRRSQTFLVCEDKKNMNLDKKNKRDLSPATSLKILKNLFLLTTCCKPAKLGLLTFLSAESMSLLLWLPEGGNIKESGVLLSPSFDRVDAPIPSPLWSPMHWADATGHSSLLKAEWSCLLGSLGALARACQQG